MWSHESRFEMEIQRQLTITPGELNPFSEEISKYLASSCRCGPHGAEEPERKQRRIDAFQDSQDFHLLSLPPRFTTIRVNLSRKTLNEAKDLVAEEVKRQFKSHLHVPAVYPHHTLRDLIVVESHGKQCVVPAKKEVIIGQRCGLAVLRGADVYAPGVVALDPQLSEGEEVAVFVDFKGRCLRGSKKFDGRKMFVGNGILNLSRKDLFTGEKPTGIAVSMKERIFEYPSIGSFHEDFLFLQNLPSVLCSHVLGAPEHAVVLDMCAAPGGKTTHIASLMNGTGSVIAIDMSQNKIDEVTANADRLGLKNIVTVKHDSTMLLKEEADSKDDPQIDNKEDGSTKEALNGSKQTDSLLPPFKPSSFKWILLNAPCSALGQRPQLHTKMSVKKMEAFAEMQRKLLKTALKLLEPGGKLVYSTYTIVPEENEKMVKWVLDNYEDIELLDSEPKLGMPGLANCGLTTEQCKKIQRFGPGCMSTSAMSNVDKDTVGFFIASFTKKN